MAVKKDVARKKPFPDPLIVCSERLGVSAGNCVYVGDSPVDIRAANAAGMMAIGVCRGRPCACPDQGTHKECPYNPEPNDDQGS